ncbi:C-type lectin domain family 2 member L-like isoform X2 [Ambystoma mexicanum]|uniref:C-type lectin domain family 2 member L-like isoform X2 n=2 Tax=Ambystoma mexicanum TaxID=8296 RepID=UPI0037E8BFC2
MLVPQVPASLPAGSGRDPRAEAPHSWETPGSSMQKMTLLDTRAEGGQGQADLWKNICFWRIIAAVSVVLLIIGILVAATWHTTPSSREDMGLPARKEKCPKDWNDDRVCYTFNMEPTSHDLANDFCSFYNASLLEIGSPFKWAWVKILSDRKDYWIGLRNHSGIFQWTSGTVYNDTLFDVHSSGECAYLRNKGIFLSDCASRRRSICEKKPYT